VHGYPVLPDDLQWSGPLSGVVSVEHVFATPQTWVKIGDPLITLTGNQGIVTLFSTYIGVVEAVYILDGQVLYRDRPLFSMAVSGWLLRGNARSPFETGVIVVSGIPSRRVDPSGTSSQLFITVDNAGRRPVPWNATCLLSVPAGDHVISAIYAQSGANPAAANQAVRIRGGSRQMLTYEAPGKLDKIGKLRS
jgi:hypothetical protein